MDHNNPTISLFRFGAVGLFLAAALLGAWATCAALAGHPPTDSGALVTWAGEHKFAIALSNEFLFFMPFALIPGLATLALLLWRGQPTLTMIGGSALAGQIVMLMTICVSLGRLVYPVFGIELGGDALVYAVSAYYGGLHAADLMAAVYAGALGFALYRSGRGIGLLLLSLLVAVAEVAVSYPWLFSPWASAALRLPLAAWWVWVGAVLISAARRPQDRA